MLPRSLLAATFAALLATLALATTERAAHAQRRTELPTLERTIELARARAIVVAEAEGELGVARATMSGARAMTVPMRRMADSCS